MQCQGFNCVEMTVISYYLGLTNIINFKNLWVLEDYKRNNNFPYIIVCAGIINKVSKGGL
jgi:hypothetical protein